MARISVKNMSRNQQKAVFANLGNGSSTVSNMTARRENLLRNDLVTETRQDKIDRIMRDNKLTHRQKMDRISRLNSSAFSRPSAAFEATGNDGRNTTDAPAVRLIYKKVLVEAEKRRLERKAYKEKHPGAEFFPTKKPGVYILKENGKTFTWKDGKKLKTKYEKTRKDYPLRFVVTMTVPAVGTEPAEAVMSKPMSKKEAQKLVSEKKRLGWKDVRMKKAGDTSGLKKKDMSYEELKKAGVKLKPNADYDGDGVKNSEDCRPMDKKKQDLFDDALALGYSITKKGAKAGAKFAKKKLYERTAKGRAEIASLKIRDIEAKRKAAEFHREQKIKAEELEKKAKIMEAEYKKEHPSLLTKLEKAAKERLAKKKSIYD